MREGAVVECYPSPAHGGRLRPLPVVDSVGPLGQLHVVGHERQAGLVRRWSPTAWDRWNPDVQRTLDWMNGHVAPDVYPSQARQAPVAGSPEEEP